MFGRLTLDALPHDPIAMGGAVMIVGGLLTVVAALTFFKKWRWLWDNWITSLDPKKIGIMYIVVALLMLLRGLADAGMMRVQQALSAGDATGILTSEHFQQVFSAHGTIMIFFVAMGLMFGLINLVLPLQLGARDVAFPFLNSVSFWLFFVGMALVNASLVIGEFSAAGWLAYPPLSGLEYSPGVGVDYWIWALQISGVGSLLSGINFVVTILRRRAPGMSLMKMPIFAWSVLCSMILVVFTFPILTATLTMLGLDRLMEMHFFTSALGGNPMMYINLIWAWGHPEVYILILPAFGIFSEIVPTFSGKRLFGYTSMVVALASITVLSYIVWLHHFFTMGAGANVNAFFGIATMVIAVPTGVKVFNWLFTMYRGRIRFTTPMIWFMAFVITFTIGGMTGVILAIPAIDYQLHNSLFLVAHFHNTIVGGVVFGFLAGIVYWFPKFFGIRLHEGLGKAAAWAWAIGFMVAFLPIYALGFMGATRRIDHYASETGWQWLFIVSAVGVGIILLGVGLLLLQIAYSVWKHKQLKDMSGGDPWDGRTLEWAAGYPVPEYGFARQPVVSTRDALWEAKQTGVSLWASDQYSDIVVPKNSPIGFFLAVASGLMAFGLIWHMWWLALVGVVVCVCLLFGRMFDDHTQRVISADEVKRLDTALVPKKAVA